jgi:hypothetical protein
VQLFKFSKSRISRAYVKLLCIPKDVEKIVALARIGNCEIRILETTQIGCNAAPLFSIELFDHHGQSPVDSCICYSLDEGRRSRQDLRIRVGRRQNAAAHYFAF